MCKDSTRKFKLLMKMYCIQNGCLKILHVTQLKCFNGKMIHFLLSTSPISECVCVRCGKLQRIE